MRIAFENKSIVKHYRTFFSSSSNWIFL